MTNQEPTPEQLRIEVAGLMGWTEMRMESEREFRDLPDDTYHEDVLAGLPPFSSGYRDIVPSYATCLNACAEMERSLIDEERKAYVEHLGGILRVHWLLMTEVAWLMATATPRQRCEAFVRVKKGEKR